MANNWSHLDVTAAAGGAEQPVEGRSVLTAMGKDRVLDPSVYYLRGDGNVIELSTHDGTRWTRTDVTTACGGPAAAALSVSSPLTAMDSRVYYQTADGHVHELSWGGTRWTHTDVTATVSSGVVPAAPAALYSPLTSMGMGSNRDPHVYYLTADGHVHELAWVNDGGQETTYTVHEPTNAGELIRASISHRGWNHRDVTQAGGSDAAVFSTSPLTAIGTGSNRDPRVYYLDTKYHVHELAWVTTQGGVLPKGSGVTVM